MTEGIRTIIYPVKDIAQAKKLYTNLDPNGHNQGMTGPVGYWHVDDIKKSLQLLLSAGAQARQETKDVGGGKLIASVKDADSNIIGLIQLPR